jgi:predicted nucleic acid-binding protein
MAHICPVVWVEISRGIRGKREERIARELSALCPSLPMDGESWEEAARLGRLASQSGLNCPLADVLIVACAKRHGATVIHSDKHFEALMKL